MKTLLQDIEEYQEKHSLTDMGFAKLIKVSPATVSRWKSGERKPEEKLANLFSILPLQVMNYLKRQG